MGSISAAYTFKNNAIKNGKCFSTNKPLTSTKAQWWLWHHCHLVASVSIPKWQFSRSILSNSLWPRGHQASLSITNAWSLLKLMPIESMMPSYHLILSRPLLLPPSIFPSIRLFYKSQFSTPGGRSIEPSASASDPPMNIQNWFPLGLTDLISLQWKGLWRIFSNTTVQKH